MKVEMRKQTIQQRNGESPPIELTIRRYVPTLKPGLIRCKWCGSRKVIYAGKGKWDGGVVQRCRCLVCGKRFKDDQSPYHMKYPFGIIKWALNRFQEGYTYREVVNLVNNQFGRKPSKQTLLQWRKSPQIKDYLMRYPHQVDIAYLHNARRRR